MSAVDTALQEVTDALVAILSPHEGLRDLSRLNLNAATMQEVRALIARFDRRVSVLTVLQTALQAVLADGYPAMDVTPISHEAYLDILAQQTTIADAIKQFRDASPFPAAALNLTAGASTSKSV